MNRADRDEVLTDEAIGNLVAAVEMENYVGTGANGETAEDLLLDTHTENGIIKPDMVVDGHSSTPKTVQPGSVIDHVNAEGKVDIRTFYGEDGLKRTEIHSGNHGNSKMHNYGSHGEHIHIYIWNPDGTLNTKKIREITETERERNRDICDE